MLIPPVISAAGAPRLPESAKRLQALLSERMGRPFEWGAHDCALWASDVVLTLTGIDPAKHWRGLYYTRLQGSRLVHRSGGLPALVRKALGDPLPAAGLACSGDVGVLDDGGRQLVAGVCLGEVWAVPTRHGLGMLPMASAVQAWRVGCA